MKANIGSGLLMLIRASPWQPPLNRRRILPNLSFILTYLDGLDFPRKWLTGAIDRQQMINSSNREHEITGLICSREVTLVLDFMCETCCFIWARGVERRYVLTLLSRVCFFRFALYFWEAVWNTFLYLLYLLDRRTIKRRAHRDFFNPQLLCSLMCVL